jgi:hypothetical protein
MIGVIEIAVGVAVVATVVAIKKHGSLSAALTSAKKEASLIEAEAIKLEGEAKAALVAIAARIKAL